MNPVETDRYAAESETLHTRFARFSARSEPRKAARQHFRGMLALVQRKNYWQMAEVVGEKDRGQNKASIETTHHKSGCSITYEAEKPRSSL